MTRLKRNVFPVIEGEIQVALLLGESTEGTAAKRQFQATQIGSLLPARSRLSG
jgi:hypothetical protein